MNDRTDKEQVALLRKVLAEAGLDYMITRIEGTIAHVNVLVGNKD